MLPFRSAHLTIHALAFHGFTADYFHSCHYPILSYYPIYSTDLVKAYTS